MPMSSSCPAMVLDSTSTEEIWRFQREHFLPRNLSLARESSPWQNHPPSWNCCFNLPILRHIPTSIPSNHLRHSQALQKRLRSMTCMLRSMFVGWGWSQSQSLATDDVALNFSRARYISTYMKSSVPSAHHAFVLAYASKHGYTDLADVAAPLTLGSPQVDVVALLGPAAVLPYVCHNYSFMPRVF